MVFKYDSYVDGTVGYVFSGAYKPYDSLSRFNGKSMNGTWQLSVKDMYQLNTGTLKEFRLEFTTK